VTYLFIFSDYILLFIEPCILPFYIHDHLERNRSLFTHEGFCRLKRGRLSKDELLAAGEVFTEYPELAVKLDIVFDYVFQIKDTLSKAYD
jgi:hypothetical protein